MDKHVSRLVEKTWLRLQETAADKRLLIGIGGIPGSGKTSLSRNVVEALNRRAAAEAAAAAAIYCSCTYSGSACDPCTCKDCRCGSSSLSAASDTATASASPTATRTNEPAVFLPMDGFRLTRAKLSDMENPEEAHFRGGVAFTFDGQGFLSLVRKLHKPIPPPSSAPSNSTSSSTEGTIYAPSLDHTVKDPKPDDIPIHPHHRVVVMEGNYLLLDEEPWSSVAKLMDECWFVEVDPEVAVQRLIARHVAAGLARNWEEAEVRGSGSGQNNGEEIVAQGLADVDEVIVSQDDPTWASKHQ